MRIRYRLLSATHIQYCRTETLQVTDDTPYYDVITQLCKLIKPSIEYECESVELYSETGYPLVTVPAYYLYPIKFWLIRSEELVYVIPKTLLPPAKSPTNNCNTKHSISIQTIKEEVTLNIELLTEENTVDVTGEEIKLAISYHIHIPPHCIFLCYRPANHRFQNQLEDSKYLNISLIEEKKTIIIFDLSEEYWAPTSLDFYASGLTQPCGLPHDALQILNTFNAELMYFVRVLTSRTKDDQLLFLGSLRKNSCSPPLVYAFFLLTQGYFISLPHKIAILEGISMMLSFAVKNKNSIQDKFPLFSKLCAYIETTSSPGDRTTEQYEPLYLPARIRRKHHDNNIRRLSMSFPDEQKEMFLWSSVRRVNQKFNAKIVLNDSINFPYKHPVELMFDFMHNRVDNGLMALTGDTESVVVFTGRSNEAYKYLKYYSPSEGKAVTFHPHDFVTIPATLTDESSHGTTLNSIIVLLDISQEMSRTDIHSSSSQSPVHKIRTDKSGFTQIAASFVLINALIDRLIRQESNYLLGLYIFSKSRPEEEFNRLVVPPTLSYNDILVAINTTLQVLIRPSIAKQTKITENPFTKGIEFCITNYHTSTLICLTNESFTTEEFTNVVRINTLVAFGGRNNFETFEKNKFGMIVNENSIDRHIANEQSRVTNYPFAESRLIEYIDIIENHIRIDNNIESAMKSPNFKEFNDYEDQLYISGNKYTSTSTPDDVLAILREVTLYMHNPNPYAKMYSNGSLKDWSITFDFHNVIPKIELLMHLPKRYPLVAPKFRLLCRIHHCNVDKRGHLCHPILFEDYKLGVSLRKVIDAMYNMLVSPVPSHAVQTKEAILYYSNHTEKKAPVLSSSFVTNKLKLRRTQSARSVRKNKPMCPDYLVCPLTNRLFENPVITPDGHTYDRDAVLLYINLNHKDPSTGSELTEEDIIPNKSISDGVAKYKRSVSIEKYWWEQKL